MTQLREGFPTGSESEDMNGHGAVEPSTGETPLPEGYSYAEPGSVSRRERAALMRSAKWNTSSPKLWSVDKYLESQGISSIEVGVRDDEGSLIGFGKVIYKGEQGELSDFVVSPEHRHRGIGKAIISERLRLAEEAGITSLYTPYLDDTNTLESYYKQKGFRRTDAGAIVRGPNPVSVVGEHLLNEDRSKI